VEKLRKSGGGIIQFALDGNADLLQDSRAARGDRMTATDPRLEAFLEDEAQWYRQYAEMCRSISSSFSSQMRERDWNSRAAAADRRSQNCLERLGNLRTLRPPLDSNS
jgi:hypothetical protein